MSAQQNLCTPLSVPSLSAETKPLEFTHREPVEFPRPDLVSLEYRVTEGDYVDAAELAALKQSRRSAGIFVAVPAMGAFCAAAGLVLTTVLGPHAAFELLVAIGSALFAIPMVSRLRFRTTYRKTLAYQDRQGIVADRQTLRRWSSTSHDKKAWQSYHSFAEDSKSFVLFQPADPQLLPIPKRTLTADEIAGLRILFEANLPRL